MATNEHAHAHAADVKRFTDAAGNELVRVKLGKHVNHGWAIFDAPDWDRLTAVLGVAAPLKWLDSGDGYMYVRTNDQKNTVVARSVLEVPERTVVHYVDGDRRNLRRSNLFTEAKRGHLAKLDRASAERRAGGAL